MTAGPTREVVALAVSCFDPFCFQVQVLKAVFVLFFFFLFVLLITIILDASS